MLDAWRERRFELVVCDLLVEELGEVLARAKFAGRISVPSRRAVLALLAQRGERHPDPAPRPGLTTDPGDDYLAALALESRRLCGAEEILVLATDELLDRSAAVLTDLGAAHGISGLRHGRPGWLVGDIAATRPLMDITRFEAEASRECAGSAPARRPRHER